MKLQADDCTNLSLFVIPSFWLTCFKMISSSSRWGGWTQSPQVETSKDVLIPSSDNTWTTENISYCELPINPFSWEDQFPLMCKIFRDLVVDAQTQKNMWNGTSFSVEWTSWSKNSFKNEDGLSWIFLEFSRSRFWNFIVFCKRNYELQLFRILGTTLIQTFQSWKPYSLPRTVLLPFSKIKDSYLV